jgi:hypothetical protein
MTARLGYIATGLFGLVLTTGGLTAWALAPATNKPTSCQLGYTRPILLPLAGIPYFTEQRTRNAAPCGKSESEARALAASENSALWAFWATVLSAIQAVVGLGGFVALIHTLRLNGAALKIASDANELSQRMSYIELRAYLSVSVKIVESLTDDRFKFQWEFTNKGSTPASDLSVYLQHAVLPNDMPADTFNFDRHVFTGSKAVLGSGDSTSHVRSIKLLDVEIAGITGGNLKFWVFGKAIYNDVFGKSQNITFLLSSSGKGFERIIRAPFGNYSS